MRPLALALSRRFQIATRWPHAFKINTPRINFERRFDFSLASTDSF
jgi:hypothetical protein